MRSAERRRQKGTVVGELDDLEEISLAGDRTNGSARSIRAGVKRTRSPYELRPLWVRQLHAEKTAATRKKLAERTKRGRKKASKCLT